MQTEMLSQKFHLYEHLLVIFIIYKQKWDSQLGTVHLIESKTVDSSYTIKVIYQKVHSKMIVQSENGTRN